MPEMTEYPPGTFCWVDLATTDAQAAKTFYTGLFGWKANDVPAGEAGTYTMFQKDGKNVCAAYGMNEQMRQQGIPPHWASYVSVADADEVAQKAQQLGGTVLAPPFDVMDVGRMAAVQDPTGAVFSLWQPKSHIGAQLVGEPGTLCWNELQTRDTKGAEEFYARLFGWTAATDSGVLGTPYTEFKHGDRPAAGMLAIQPEWGEIPPNWAVYFAVADCDATLEKAQSLGATVVVPAMDIPRVGRFGVLHDPQGAHFAVIRLSGAGS